MRTFTMQQQIQIPSWILILLVIYLIYSFIVSNNAYEYIENEDDASVEKLDLQTADNKKPTWFQRRLDNIASIILWIYLFIKLVIFYFTH